jgi:HD superfamily phosphohydrolase
MFQLAVLEHFKDSEKNLYASFFGMDDATCMQALRDSENPVARDIALRIYERRLYKRALYVGTDQVSSSLIDKRVPLEKCREFASMIASLVGLKPHEVLVDIPLIPKEMSLGVKVENQHALAGVKDLSPRIQTLNATRLDQWRLGVYTLPKFRQEVAEAASEVLHIKKQTRQHTLF